MFLIKGYNQILHIYRLRKKIKKFYLEKGFVASVRMALQFITGSLIRKHGRTYDSWIKNCEHIPSRTEMEGDIKTWKYLPKISLITPVYNVDPKWLNLCIQSVVDQGYPYWELCLYDDASPSQETLNCLKQWEVRDERIKVSYGKQNLHISGASNKAIQIATGEFIGLLDNDDTLAPHALFEVVALLQKHPHADFIYSDEDKIDLKGVRSNSFFKPDWSRHLLLSMMYTCHFTVYRRSVVQKVGGFRLGFEGSQDHDLALRIIEVIPEEHIFHVPKILYHWRMIPGSTALRVDGKSYAVIAGQKALQGYLDRNNPGAQIIAGDYTGVYRNKYIINQYEKVSIIIPQDTLSDEDFALHVTTVRERIHYPSYEIIPITNNDKNLSLAEKYNQGALVATGAYLLFLTETTEVLDNDWISPLVEYAQQSDIGVVGSRVLDHQRRIYHMGIILGVGRGIGYVFRKHFFGYYAFDRAAHEYSAVALPGVMIRKKVFESLLCFDADRFPEHHFVIDFCLRARNEKLLTICTPFAEFVYNPDFLQKGVSYEEVVLSQKWPEYMAHDPYYNPNLSKKYTDYSLD